MNRLILGRHIKKYSQYVKCGHVYHWQFFKASLIFGARDKANDAIIEWKAEHKLHVIFAYSRKTRSRGPCTKFRISLAAFDPAVQDFEFCCCSISARIFFGKSSWGEGVFECLFMKYSVTCLFLSTHLIRNNTSKVWIWRRFFTYSKYFSIRFQLWC